MKTKEEKYPTFFGKCAKCETQWWKSWNNCLGCNFDIIAMEERERYFRERSQKLQRRVQWVGHCENSYWSTRKRMSELLKENTELKCERVFLKKTLSSVLELMYRNRGIEWIEAGAIEWLYKYGDKEGWGAGDWILRMCREYREKLFLGSFPKKKILNLSRLKEFVGRL